MKDGSVTLVSVSGATCQGTGSDPLQHHCQSGAVQLYTWWDHVLSEINIKVNIHCVVTDVVVVAGPMGGQHDDKMTGVCQDCHPCHNHQTTSHQPGDIRQF